MVHVFIQLFIKDWLHKIATLYHLTKIKWIFLFFRRLKFGDLRWLLGKKTVEFATQL